MKALKLFAIAVGMAGFGLLFAVGWKVALGVFLFAWGNNLATGKR